MNSRIIPKSGVKIIRRIPMLNEMVNIEISSALVNKNVLRLLQQSLIIELNLM